MHPCFFSQGPRFIALICLHPRSCEITLGHWTLKLDIGHWNWILKLDIKTGHWTLKFDIHYWNWTFTIEIGHSLLKLDIQLWQSAILKPKVMLTFIWMHRLLFNNNKDKYLNWFLFCNLLICEGWIYWYNLSPLRGGEIGQHVIIILHYPPYSVHFTSEILLSAWLRTGFAQYDQTSQGSLKTRIPWLRE